MDSLDKDTEDFDIDWENAIRQNQRRQESINALQEIEDALVNGRPISYTFNPSEEYLQIDDTSPEEIEINLQRAQELFIYLGTYYKESAPIDRHELERISAVRNLYQLDDILNFLLKNVLGVSIEENNIKVGRETTPKENFYPLLALFDRLGIVRDYVSMGNFTDKDSEYPCPSSYIEWMIFERKTSELKALVISFVEYQLSEIAGEQPEIIENRRIRYLAYLARMGIMYKSCLLALSIYDDLDPTAEFPQKKYLLANKIDFAYLLVGIPEKIE